MTLEQIRESDKAFLTPAEAAEALGCRAYAINVQARQDPARLGFPVSVIGRRVRIPRLGFLRWADGGAAQAMTDDQVRAEFDRQRNWITEQILGEA